MPFTGMAKWSPLMGALRDRPRSEAPRSTSSGLRDSVLVALRIQAGDGAIRPDGLLHPALDWGHGARVNSRKHWIPIFELKNGLAKCNPPSRTGGDLGQSQCALVPCLPPNCG